MATRNSDGSYDAVDSGSGGFGKDYHGQDAFGERFGGTGIGGSHFGGKAAGDFSDADELGEGHFTERYTDYGQAMATESPTEIGDATEVASNMRDTLRGVNEETTENSNTGSMDTSLQIGGGLEDPDREELERAARELYTTKDTKAQAMNLLNTLTESTNNVINQMESKSISDKIAGILNNNADKIIDNLVRIAEQFGYYDEFDRNKIEEAYKEKGPEGLRNVSNEIYKTVEAYFDNDVKVAQDKYDKIKSRIDSYESSFTDKTTNSKDTKAATPSEVMEDTTSTKAKTKEERYAEAIRKAAAEDKDVRDVLDMFDTSNESSFTDKTTNSKDTKAATPSEVMEDTTSTKAKTKEERYAEAIRKAAAEDKDVRDVLDMFDTSNESSFTDKMEPSTTEAKPGTNMASAKTSPSDYLTKSNKDSTKEVPTKEAPSRNDFGNHAADTLKGVTDRITGSVTADALGLKSIEDFAKENGYDPNKLSTMKAYQSYQNKEIMKAIPGLVKQIGSYIVERVKDAVDPSQLGERVRNTLARYNLATLIGAAILSIKSGAGLQASIDQALTMVDTEDQPAVSDYLEDVLSDEGTVNDLGNAFDDALAPEQNSDTAELDESIVNIGRKDNTDYSGFNAGLGSSGTTSSDADVKVFIARNVKADPILRKMISKIGK